MQIIYSNYKITNTINQMLYIGSTSLPPDVRWTQHKSNARTGRLLPLYTAMREYGIENFTFEVMKQHKKEEAMFHHENSLILSLHTLMPDGYNTVRVRSNKINLDDWYTTEEARKRLSENSGREIDANYPRTLARNGKITTLDIGSRGKLYLKRDVDHIVVSTQRGPKARPHAEKGREASTQGKNEESASAA